MAPGITYDQVLPRNSESSMGRSDRSGGQNSARWDYCRRIYDCVVFFSTRYFGKIGSIPRMLVLAQKLGVKHVSIVGMDGLPPPDKFNKSSAGVFEDKKPSDDPNSNYYNLYRKHYIMIWDHILNDLDKDKNITFHNYGKNYEFNMTKDIPESR